MCICMIQAWSSITLGEHLYGKLMSFEKTCMARNFLYPSRSFIFFIIFMIPSRSLYSLIFLVCSFFYLSLAPIICWSSKTLGEHLYGKLMSFEKTCMVRNFLYPSRSSLISSKLKYLIFYSLHILNLVT